MFERNDDLFFVKPVNYTDDNGETIYTALTAEFGDGLNRINTTIFPDKVGIMVFRNTDLDPGLKLDIANGDEVPNPGPDQEVIALNFHTLQSIDAVIGRLQYIRDVMVDRTKAPHADQTPEQDPDQDLTAVETKLTYEAGDNCPDCEGTLEHYPDECACAVSPPPCSACTDAPLSCCVCGWNEKDQ
ncbi:hypothetical protein [Vibrio phage vB_ValS_PJ32]|nr:hypothetical protein [Vibrio phage vB_ValS_PJ32]